MKLIKGNELPANLREHVLSCFIYRLTTENGYPARNPCKASVPAISDAQWLKEHAFYVTKAGTLAANRKYAEPAFMADSQ